VILVGVSTQSSALTVSRGFIFPIRDSPAATGRGSCDRVPDRGSAAVAGGSAGL